MPHDNQSQVKWVLYYYGFGVTNAVACADTPEELMPQAGIGQPVKWIDQGGRYIGFPFGGDVHADFRYTINRDGEQVYKIMAGQHRAGRHKSLSERLYDWLCPAWVK